MVAGFTFALSEADLVLCLSFHKIVQVRTYVFQPSLLVQIYMKF